MVFTKANVLVDTTFKNNNELFEKIASLALKRKIISDKQLIIDGFVNREAQGTTGFEDGFAIPHARVKGVNEPSVFVIRNSEKFEGWEALDGQGVKYAIALLIPDTAGEVHMEVLSSIATKLIDEKFREIIKKGSQEQIFKSFNAFLKDIETPKKEEKVEEKNDNKKLIIGISACPAGIAHTFMAKQKMEDGAKELGYNIKWETQGANGQKNKLEKEDIDKAEVVIIASDIKLDLSRFKGKKLYATDTNDAIKNGSKLITKAINESPVYDGSEIKHKSAIMNFFKTYKQAFQSSFGTPWIYLSITGTLLAIISLIGFSMYGQDWSKTPQILNDNLFKIQEIAIFALHLSMPFMAATIAKKMIDRGEVFAIAFIGALLLNIPYLFETTNAMTGLAAHQNTNMIFMNWSLLEGQDNLKDISYGSNIIGAILTTFITVIVVKFIFFVRAKINANSKLKFIAHGLSPWWTTTTVAVIVLIGFVFVFGMPLAWVSGKIVSSFLEYGNDHWWVRFLIAGTLGCLISVDLGGFINKSALIALIGLAQTDLRFAAIISVGIPLASIGLGTTWSVYKNKFREEDKADAKSSFRKGLNGMTEGPLNLTNKYGWKLILPNIVSTFVATGLAFTLGLYIFKGGHIGILYVGAQAHLAQANDIAFLRELLPMDIGWGILPISILYGIVGYYLVMFIGSITYVGIASVTFNIGKNKIFVPRKAE